MTSGSSSSTLAYSMPSEVVRRAQRMKVRQAAMRVLSDLRINDISTIRDHLPEVCIARGTEVFEQPLDGVDGQIVRRADGAVRLVVNSNLQRQRRRFSLGHELGHHEQHGEASQLKVCTSRDLRDYTTDPQEVEANQFSAYLLMPPALFDEQAEDGFPAFGMVRDLAVMFDTSMTATARRVIECTSYRAAIIATTPNRVAWWDTSERFKARIDMRQLGLSRMSRAWKLFNGKTSDATTSEEVDPSAWLENPDGLDSVYESSVHIKSWGMCLSLIVLRR